MRLRHFERRTADPAADVENLLALGSQVAQQPRDVAGAARRHVALAPDELEHGDHVVVIFVFVRAHA